MSKHYYAGILHPVEATLLQLRPPTKLISRQSLYTFKDFWVNSAL